MIRGHSGQRFQHKRRRYPMHVSSHSNILHVPDAAHSAQKCAHIVIMQRSLCITDGIALLFELGPVAAAAGRLMLQL